VAFVVENGTARERILSLGMRTADGLVEVRSGIQAGELVVVRGAESLRDGVFVRVASPVKPGDSGPETEGRP
jgi:multidrug efflux system membrane fusion protein